MTESEWLASEDPAAMLHQLQNWSFSPAYSQVGDYRRSERKLRLFACACVRQVWHLLTDERSRRAVEVAERFADGEATDGELNVAYEGAFEADTEINGDNALPPETGNGALRMAYNAAYTNIHVGLRSILIWGRKQSTASLLRDIVGNPFRSYKVMHAGQRKLAQTVKNYVTSPAPFHKEWFTPTVLSLARAAYEERVGVECDCSVVGMLRGRKVRTGCLNCRGTGVIDNGTLNPQRLAILADALEDAGCTDMLCERCEGTGVCALSRRLGISRPAWGHECEVCKGKPIIPHPILSHLRGPGPHVRGCWVVDLILGKE